jgi:hypothetical protein
VEEQKLTSEAQAIMVKNYPDTIPMDKALAMAKAAHKKIHDLPKRSLADHVAGNPVTASLASCLAEPTAVASSSSVTLDDAPSQVAALLPYDDSNALAGDIPMDKSMEVLDINQVPELEEVNMLNASHSPYPWHREWEDYDEPMNELDPDR